MQPATNAQPTANPQSATSPQPSPMLFFETLTAHQRTAAVKAAIELDVFTAIAEGHHTAQTIAERCAASERGIRILCDYLTICGFLTKQDNQYNLTPDSEIFLNRHSPAYAGGAIDFLLSPMIREAHENLTEAVRAGSSALPDGASIAPENPTWVKFARGMMPLMMLPAQRIAEMVVGDAPRPLKVLDIAAGHGLFGIQIAQRNREAEIYAVDWANVLEVAKENAARARLSERYHTIPGSAFDVEFGADYDVALLTNFLHHFDPPTCEKLLRKIYAALNTDGELVTLEFVPNEDRITPPATAAFSLMMLATTPNGDAYTFAELERMLRHAGFARNEFYPLPPTPHQLVISHKH